MGNDRKVQTNELGPLSGPVADLYDAKFRVAAEGAEKVADDRTARDDERAAGLFVAASARAELCYREKAQDDCKAAKSEFSRSSRAFDELLKPYGFIDRSIAAKWREDYKEELTRFKTLAGQRAEEMESAIKTGPKRPKIGEVKGDSYSYRPSNIRMGPPEVKFSILLKRQMCFEPDLKGIHYIRKRVFPHYDATRNKWTTKPHDFSSYTLSPKPTHHYSGGVEFQNIIGRFIYGEGELLVLNIPDGFSLDASSVRLNGSYEGFDIVQDKNGIVYLRVREPFWGKPKVEYDMSSDGGVIDTSLPEEEAVDPMPDVSIPSFLAELSDKAKFRGARDVYEMVGGFIRQQLEYPEMKDILNGRALYPAADGEEFFRNIAQMKLADCDVSNSYAVVLLRKLGVPARLVSGFYIDSRGIGLHGWLEYWDDFEGKWMRGDVTPFEKKRDQTGKSEKWLSSNLKPLGLIKEETVVFGPDMRPSNIHMPTEWLHDDGSAAERTWEKLASNVHSPSEKWEDNLVFEHGDHVQNEFSKQPMLSEPAGRYLFSALIRDKQIRLYDVERKEFVSIPAAGYDGFYVEAAYETPKGPLVRLRRDAKNGYTENREEVINAQGAKVCALIRTPENYLDFIHFTEHVPYIRVIRVSNPHLPNVYATESQAHETEDPSGKLRLILVRAEDKPEQALRVAEVDLSRNRSKVISISLEDFNPISSGSFREIDSRVSPSGEFYAFTFEMEGDTTKEIRVFSGQKEIYRYQIPVHSGDVDFQINNDASLDIAMPDEDRLALTSIHVNLNGEENIRKESILKLNRQTCAVTDEKIRCLTVRIEDVAVVDPRGKIDSPYIEGTFDELATYLKIEERAKLWSATLDQREHSVPPKKQSLVNVEVDPAARVLEEMLRAHPDRAPRKALRMLLDSIAQRPDAYVFSDWVLMGASQLFDSLAESLKVRESNDSLYEARDNLEFLKKDGALLAERFLGDIEATGYFPNDATLVKGWSYILAGALIGSKENIGDASLVDELIGRMLREPDKLAEAIIAGIDAGVIEPGLIPKLDLINIVSLQPALVQALERRRDNILHSGENLLFGMGLFKWNSYMVLEDAIKAHFGAAAIPPPVENDW